MSAYRALILAVSALVSQPSLADNSCVPYLECQPLTTKAVRGPLATHLFWFVRNPTTGGIDHHGFSSAHEVTDLQQFKDAANQVLTGKMTPDVAWREYMRFECDYSRWTPFAGENPICRERKVALLTQRDEWLADFPRNVSQWKVKSNGSFSTRPAFTLIGTVRGTKEVARAAVGAPCNPSKPTLVSGSDLWAEFGTSGVVALCSKVAQ